MPEPSFRSMQTGRSKKVHFPAQPLTITSRLMENGNLLPYHIPGMQQICRQTKSNQVALEKTNAFILVTLITAKHLFMDQIGKVNAVTSDLRELTQIQRFI